MNRLVLLFAIFLLWIVACSPEASTEIEAPPKPLPQLKIAPTGQPSFEFIVPPSFQHQSFMPMPNPMQTPAWTVQGPGSANISILLYHHIDVPQVPSQYYVPPKTFEQQLSLLSDMGCTTIKIERMVKAIKDGVALPPCPIIITFDDGNLDNYTNAFPIMKKYGFVGVIYVVADFIDSDGYMTKEQIRELLQAGWELGSHTMDHASLVQAKPEHRSYEVRESKKYLEQEFDVSVLTLAYPFGEYDRGIMNLAYSSGYVAAMGLGDISMQYHVDRYALHRLSVRGWYDLDDFANLLFRRDKYSALK